MVNNLKRKDMTHSQKEIYQFVRQKGQATKKEIVMKFADHCYCNGEKYVGDRLSRMVDAGFLVRVKKGLYKPGIGKRNRPATIDENQIQLF